MEPIEGKTPTIGTQDPPPGGNGDAFTLPDAYKDKPYLKDVASMDDVYKKLDGAQTLIGQKVTFPTENSTDEERVNFYKSAGMPEKAEDYSFEKIGEAEREPELDIKVKEIFHNAGVSAEAATKIQKGYETWVIEAMAARQEASDNAFGEMTTELFGDKADETIASGKKLIEENIPESMVDKFTNLPSEALVVMTSVLDNIKKKYIGEDKIIPGGGGSGASTEAELRAKAQGLMNNPAYKDAMHADYKKVNQEIRDIYAQIGKMN